MKKILAAVLSFALLLSCLPVALAAEPEALSRGEAAEMLLNAADDYNPGVQKSDIIKGYPDGTLREEAGVTRVEALVMLSRAFGDLPAPTGFYALTAYDASEFTDVPAWAMSELENVFQSGIVRGTSDTTFNPYSPVTREHMELFIRRVYALEGSNLKDDFYAAVNHEYLTTTDLSDGYPEHSALTDLGYESNNAVAAIIPDILQSGGTTDAEKKILILFDNYMDWNSRAAVGLTPIQPYLDGISAAATAQELLALNAQIAEDLGITLLLSFTCDASREDDSMVLIFEPYTPFLGRNGYAAATENSKNAYMKLAATLLECSGETKEEAQRQAMLCWDTESVLAAAMLSVQDASNAAYTNNFRTLEELRQLFPAADLPALLASQNLKEEESARVAEVKLMEACGELFQDKNLDAMKALMQFTLLRKTANYLTRDLSNAMLVYEYSSYGIALDLSGRTEEDMLVAYRSQASARIKELIPDYLEMAYVERYSSAKVKADVENMLRDLIATFRQRIADLDWMSDTTKEKAYKKLDNMRIRVGYPDQWESALDNASILSASEGGSLFQNWVEIQKASQNAVAEKQGKPQNKDEWHYPVYTVNAAYGFEQNVIEVPAGILHAPYYDVNASYEENLGGIGYILAHEISHAFDNNGAQYDENGRLNNWWTAEDLAAFQALCQKVVEYYDGKECAPGITCNGAQNLSENIADVGALACITQIVSQRENPDFETLYRSAARTWRCVTTRERLESFARTNIHAPDALRGQLPLQTCDEFYQTFNITEGDGMWIPPEERVSIW